jgi:hypothetical protein
MATKKKPSKVKLLSESQQLYISTGALNRNRLRESILRAIDRKTPRDFYIYSPPGLGKSYTTELVFQQKNIVPIRIEGNTSLFGFVVDMAMIQTNRNPKQHLFLFIDDCDNLLLHKDSVNTLKIALQKGILAYNKSLTAQYNQLEDIQKECIDQFRVQGRNGVSIPMDNMTIIWCSNYKLADQKDVARATSDTQRQKYIDEEALRRRLNARDYDVEGNELWGWIADCVLNETPTSMKSASREQLEQILVWMHANWSNLKEHNISFAEKLFEEMELDPDSYLTAWEYDYLIG